MRQTNLNDILQQMVDAPVLGRIHRWLSTPPDDLKPEYADFYSLSNYTHAFGLLSHIFFFPLFILIGVPELALFNIFSLAIFVTTLYWSKRGKLDLTLLVGGVEVSLHQSLAVAVLGLAPGFQYYFLVLVVGTLFYGHIPLLTRIFMAIVPLGCYLSTYLYALHHAPLRQLSPLVIDGLAVMNAVFFVAILMGSCIYFQHSVQLARIHAEKMAQSKTLFLANMSHELRTPLNAILGFAQILNRSKSLNEQERRNLTTINRSGEYLLELINGILDMSKMEEGKLALQPTTCNLRQMLADLQSMFQLAARNKEIEFHTEHAADLPAIIRTDELRLRQVLINLLGNAMKFTARGHVKLTVRVLDHPTPGLARLNFMVEDTGGGIAREEMGDLFQLFTQTESGRRSRKGTGLGLALSRRFIELMNGQIGVESELGQGSTFWFIIPVEVSESLATAKVKEQKQIVGLKPGTAAPKMLIADDNAENREVLQQLLAGLGFEVLTAPDGAIAVELWRQHTPDIIWMDLRMPVMDGYTACSVILKSAVEAGSPKPPIIAITASTVEEGSARLTQAGFAALIGKPFREADIYTLIQRHTAVEFLYAEESTSTSELNETAGTEDKLSDALARLPAELQEQLRNAATLADFDGLQQAAQRIASNDPALAARLRDLVDNYRFDVIQEALNSLTHRTA